MRLSVAVVSKEKGAELRERDWLTSCRPWEVDWVLFKVGGEAFEGLGWGKGSDMMHGFKQCSGIQEVQEK